MFACVFFFVPTDEPRKMRRKFVTAGAFVRTGLPSPAAPSEHSARACALAAGCRELIGRRHRRCRRGCRRPSNRGLHADWTSRWPTGLAAEDFHCFFPWGNLSDEASPQGNTDSIRVNGRPGCHLPRCGFLLGGRGVCRLAP